MSMTEQVNDVVEQAAGLLLAIDMSDWMPPANVEPKEAERLYIEEVDRRDQARIQAYLDGRTDALAMLREVHHGATARSSAYAARSEPWARMAARQRRIAEYAKQLASKILGAECVAAGEEGPVPYSVEQADGTKIGLKQSPPAVVILCVDDLPRRFVQDEPKVLKKELTDALKNGPVSGAKLTRGLHVSWGR